MTKKYCLLLAFMGAFSLIQAYAVASSNGISELEKSETINAVARIVKDYYVFPDIGERISDQLLENLERGEYESIADYEIFSERLTNDIQSFNGDKHLRVLFEPERIKKQEEPIGEEALVNRREERFEKLRKNNFGFKEVRILEGNIGYLNLMDFADPTVAGETAAAAMKMLENSYAIVIDLRENGGGPPSMVQLLASYFLDPEPTHLNSFYKRKENITKQFWSLPYVPGNRVPDTPLYLLTSSRTFSAAEEFCYDLQQMKRAIVVGEQTAGGAHPGGRIRATESYNVWTPTARAINPISNNNWEGVGIRPDIAVPAEEAFEVAYQAALNLVDSSSQ